MSDADRHIEGLENLPGPLRGCVLTIGNFDGVHLGHQRILEAARRLGGQCGAPVVAMTFEPPPDLVLRPDDQPQRITPAPQRARRLLEHGAQWVLTARIDREFLCQPPERFIEDLIVGRFAPRHVVEGPDFYFGRGRAGNIELLRQAGLRHGFGLHVVAPVVLELPEGPQRVSSTLIRGLILAGRVTEAARCLGRAFALFGRVVPGAGQGRVLDFPTANLDPDQQVLPADGVYAGWADLPAGRFPAAISVGTKPTLGPGPRTVEAFLLEARGRFYGQEMTLSFVDRLRDQRRFEDIEPLRAQIAKDVDRVRERLGQGR